jgi:putative ABC transport system permease protein
MLFRVISNFNIAFEAVLANKLRSFLTALGIIFGVAAVISMLAIGAGAQQEILEQIKLVGVNNIVVTPIVEQEEEELQEGSATAVSEQKRLSNGLSLYDVESIKKIVPGVEQISPEIVLETHLIKNAIRRSAKLVGVENGYFDISGFELHSGKFFNSDHLNRGEPVCIIGRGIMSKFFSQEDPIGKYIKVGKHWLRIVGVLKERIISERSIENLGIRDYNMDIYAPIKTVLLRYENRGLVTAAAIRMYNRSRDRDQSSTNYHQIDRMVIRVAETDNLYGIQEVVSKLLKRKHAGIVDYEITVPELLLKQQQRTTSIFNFVLGAIAGISLLVGGIGIMNIMLASVLERIKEIGLRMSLGATGFDIILQFLFESVMISISGGLIGVILGTSLAFGIASVAEIPTIVTPFSIILSFGVAATVGLIFGIAPARRAAMQDPITSLRYE